MTNHLRNLGLLILFPILTLAAGRFELRIHSPRTIVIEETVCSQFSCPIPDETAKLRKATAEAPLHIKTAPYPHDSKEQIDVHLRVYEPESQKFVASWHSVVTADTEFQEFTIPTTANFNVTMLIRNLCDPNYFTKTCGTICLETETFRCTNEGERVCKDGWEGSACSKPICKGNCSGGRGECVAPDVCECKRGFSGTSCENCLPTPGCVNGGCERDIIPNTCVCRPGFVGPNCDIDMGMCSGHRNPCQNQGNCTLDQSISRGFKCSCPFGFVGHRCETAVEDVRCSADERTKHVCLNGGECISSSLIMTQCACPQGFSGRFCELGGARHSSCATLTCSGDSKCVELPNGPACIGSVVPASTEFPPFVSLKDWNKISQKNTIQHSSQEMSQSGNVIALALLISIGLCVAMGIAYSNFIRPRRRRAAGSLPLPTTCSSPQPSPCSSTLTSPPAYKVCIIDAERGLATSSFISSPSSSSAGCSSSSDPTEPSQSHRPRSPPPAYSSPVLPRASYKSVPTKCPPSEDEPPFRNDEDVV